MDDIHFRYRRDAFKQDMWESRGMTEDQTVEAYAGGRSHGWQELRGELQARPIHQSILTTFFGCHLEGQHRLLFLR